MRISRFFAAHAHAEKISSRPAPKRPLRRLYISIAGNSTSEAMEMAMPRWPLLPPIACMIWSMKFSTSTWPRETQPTPARNSAKRDLCTAACRAPAAVESLSSMASAVLGTSRIYRIATDSASVTR